jgi:transcriptional regulator with XRE-family HTH domain
MDDDMIINFGVRVRLFRQLGTMTQTELAYKSGVTKQTISYWEKGDTTDCSAKSLNRCAKVLGTTIDYLLNGSI